MQSTNHILVAGAGPVGLTAALTLAQAGVRVTLLEKRRQLNQASKASTFHPPTLEILDRLQVFEAVRRLGQKVDRIQYRSPAAGIIGELPFSRLQGLTPLPFRMHLEQSLLTPILLERLRTCPQATILFDTELTDATDLGDRVKAAVRAGDGATQTIECRYLLGTDGSHSRVRSAAGIEFDGVPYPGKVLRYLTDADLGKLLPNIGPITYLVGESHSASFLRMPDRWRIIVRVPPGTQEDHAMSEPWIMERLGALIPELRQLPHCVGMDVYGATKGTASSHRRGNIILAGDSAHLSNTRGGMNMNCGIHDAFHIATAMAAVTRDGVPQEGLFQVVDERQRVARELLIPRTDAMVSAEGAWIDRVRSLLTDPAKAREHLRQTAMLDMTTPLSNRQALIRN